MSEIDIRRPGDLGQVISAVRTQRGLRQEDLADALGVSRTYVAGLESGHSTTQLLRLFRAMRMLGIHLTATVDEVPSDG
ncbi:helix-turn-helix domain-containing protein [uncultured Microbacterium sp.]|mgnify:CR=1 FL=1|jgi:transcriptional regulator with XRE-family HTH domain|uniref:helix-turn-helix transcriptional regulator n=1 Tax=uncultured Microbacterium sp. TaxID=191216 RepID=UPI0026266378|nr:helix-turn-helix domain-containing protein [uncultured Microbacterium sp.]